MTKGSLLVFKALLSAWFVVFACNGAMALAAKPLAGDANAPAVQAASDGLALGKPGTKLSDATGKLSEASPSEPEEGKNGTHGLTSALGLAWLAAALGLGPAAAVWLMVPIALLLVVGLWTGFRNRSGKKLFAAGPEMAFDGPRSGSSGALHQARDYSPQNVGNDASARPWERQSGFQSSRFSDTPSEPAPETTSPGWGTPQGFDGVAFLEASKANFINLQAAWDQADIPALRAMMTDEMVNQIRTQLTERERHSPGVANVTEVVMLEAHLLGVEEGESGYVASVEFSGLIREDVSAGPSPFREVWNITRPKTGPSGWLVAGVQALQ